MKSFGLSIEAILNGGLALPSPESACGWDVEEQSEMWHELTRRPHVHRAQ